MHGVDVVIDGVTKIYTTREGTEVLALERTDLTVESGEFVAIVGPSGCGKSTLLSLIAGLTPVSSGSIIIGGQDVRRTHPTISVVFQTDLLLYWRTIIDNIMLPVEFKRWKKANICRTPNVCWSRLGSAASVGNIRMNSPAECASVLRSVGPLSSSRDCS